MLAGAVMELMIGNVFGGITMGSMTLSDRFTLISNIVGIVAVVLVAAASRTAVSGADSQARS